MIECLTDIWLGQIKDLSTRVPSDLQLLLASWGTLTPLHLYLFHPQVTATHFYETYNGNRNTNGAREEGGGVHGCELLMDQDVECVLGTCVLRVKFMICSEAAPHRPTSGKTSQRPPEGKSLLERRNRLEKALGLRKKRPNRFLLTPNTTQTGAVYHR